MKNRDKKIIAVGLGVCFWALWFALMLFVTKPHTKKIVIWLPDNYELENNVNGEVVSIISKPDIGHQSDKVFYSQIDMDSFKKLFGKSQVVAVKIQDASRRPGNEWYEIVYQKELDCADKSFIVSAREYHRYNKRTLSEMRIRDRELFLKNKRNTDPMYLFSILGFVMIAAIISLYWSGLNLHSKQSNN